MVKKGRPQHPDRVYAAQSISWARARSQAKYRQDEWSLTKEDWIAMWQLLWHQRGRKLTDYCMRQIDPKGGWHTHNVEMVTREIFFKEQPKRNQGK